MEEGKIILYAKTKGKKEFSLKHAEDLLNLEKESKINEWNIPEDSEYHFVNGKLIRKRDSRDNKKTKKKGSDRQGDKARE